MKVSYHPANFGGHRQCGSRDIMVLVCHVISQDHLINGSSDFVGRSTSKQVTTLQNLVAIVTLAVEL